MKEPIIIDNFLPEDQYQYLYNVIDDSQFVWKRSTIVDEKELLCDSKFNQQFTHGLYYGYNATSSYCHDITKPIIVQSNKDNNMPVIRALSKAKVNCNLVTESIIQHGYHTDSNNKGLTAIYYLNSNNGYTSILWRDNVSVLSYINQIKEDTNDKRKDVREYKVESIANRIVIFPSDLLHTGSTCTNCNKRYVLNVNYH